MGRHWGRSELGHSRRVKQCRGWDEASQGRMAEKREEVGRAAARRSSWPMVEGELGGDTI